MSDQPTPDGNEPARPAGDGGSNSEGAETDGGRSDRRQPHTVRLELVDEPGQLLAALRPIADNGGNLLSIFHERGNVTPRGRIPVEVDLECPPDRFEAILGGLREEGINVIEADAERYGEEVTLVLVGGLVETDLSETLESIETAASASLTELSLSSPGGSGEPSSARIRLATTPGRTDAALAAVREVADRKGLGVVEPLLVEGSA